MLRDAVWTSLASNVFASGIVMLLLFFAVAYAVEPGSPLAPWMGLLQACLDGVHVGDRSPRVADAGG
jgi:hypothetical protein